MNAWQKAYQGWFGGCNGVKFSDSGTFNLLPFEDACSGAQFLQFKAPKTRTYNRPAGGGGSGGKETFTHYYLELRTPRDFDGTLVAGSKGSSRWCSFTWPMSFARARRRGCTPSCST